ncbi:MAG: FmdE family protein [Syntrophorhabdaceae bacterium]|nr:FmdE family protein [Syntrophorhabdaceae bacterium]
MSDKNTYTGIDGVLIKKTEEFHGHFCPGLAIGIRVADYIAKKMGRAYDEEIVAVVETDMCAVDAIQFITGCTFGKGNLIFKDYGKIAFTFFSRRDDKGIRIVAKNNVMGPSGRDMATLTKKQQEEGLSDKEYEEWQTLRDAAIKYILESDFSELFELKIPPYPVPQRARRMMSITCESCAESVMETRIRRIFGKYMCIPCFESLEKR